MAFPEPVTIRLSLPLSCKVSPDPRRPETVPPMVKIGAQTTCTFVTLAVGVPVPLAMLQVCVGLDGCVLMMMWKVPPLVMLVLNVKGTAPVPVIARSSPPLSCKTSPLPDSPSTDPPMVNGPPEPEPPPDPDPPPEPEPPPEPDPPPPAGFLTPLHAERAMDIAIRTTSADRFWLDLITLFSS